MEWRDSGSELHALTVPSFSFPHRVLHYIVANSPKTCMPCIVKLEDRSIPGQFDMHNLTVVPPDSHGGVTSEYGLAVPCQFTFFNS